MLPNLIFLFNLLDVIPHPTPNVQLYRKAGDTQDIIAVVRKMSPLYTTDFIPKPGLSCCPFADLIRKQSLCIYNKSMKKEKIL